MTMEVISSKEQDGYAGSSPCLDLRADIAVDCWYDANCGAPSILSLWTRDPQSDNSSTPLWFDVCHHLLVQRRPNSIPVLYAGSPCLRGKDGGVCERVSAPVAY